MTLVVKSCQLLVLLVGGLLPTSLFSINGNNIASEIYIESSTFQLNDARSFLFIRINHRYTMTIDLLLTQILRIDE